MAHFAKLENGVVVDIIRVADMDCGDLSFPESEPVGQAFIASIGLEGEWKQCSYSASFRKNFPEPTGVYLPEPDVFTRRRPFPSWELDSNYDWQPPVPFPDDMAFDYTQEGTHYLWNEEHRRWDVDSGFISASEFSNEFID